MADQSVLLSLKAGASGEDPGRFIGSGSQAVLAGISDGSWNWPSVSLDGLLPQGFSRNAADFVPAHECLGDLWRVMWGFCAA